MTRRTVLTVGLAVVAVALIAGLWAFEPWRAFTRNTVDEAAPAPASTVASGSGPSVSDVPAEPAPGTPAPLRPAELGRGGFVSQEHRTSGSAVLLRLADGSRVLRLEDFATSDGPDVHVWLTDQPAGADWHSYDDGRHVPLGRLKGTDGNQNYQVPADAELAGLRSVVIWCDRFNVAFGSAPL